VPKRSRRPADLNRLAASIVDEATNEHPPEPESPKARAGRIGGQTGRLPGNFCGRERRDGHVTRTAGPPKPYPTTPAMAAGVADHVWTLKEIAGLLD